MCYTKDKHEKRLFALKTGSLKKNYKTWVTFFCLRYKSVLNHSKKYNKS